MIAWILSLSWREKLAAAAIILFVAAGAYVGYLTNQREKAQKAAKVAAEEAERLKQQNEALKVLQNTNTIAGEIENDKKLANAQANNSNVANAQFNNSVLRDSGTFSGNYNATRERFCKNFPEDSRCKR